MAITEYTDVTSCRLLLKSGTDVFSDSGTTAAVEGSLVQQWNDLSGQGNHATQTGLDTVKPVFTSDGICFDVWRSGGVTPNPLLNVPGTLSRRACSFLYVFSSNSVDGASYIFSIGGNTFVISIQNGILNLIGGTTRTTSLKIRSAGKQAILVVSDAAETRFYLNTAVSVQTSTVMTSGTTSTQLQIGGTQACRARIYETAWWSKAVDSTEAGDILSLAVSRHSIETAPTSRIIFDGDSITYGVGATLNRGWTARLGMPPTVALYNHGNSGAQFTNVNADVVADIDSYPDKSSAWLLLYLGTNDASAGRTGAEIYADAEAYCNARVAAGFLKAQIAIGTLFYASTGSSAYNTLLRAGYTGFAGRLVDIALDADIGYGSPLGDPYRYQGNHLTDAGYQIFADIFNQTVPELKPPVAGTASEVSHSHNSAVISWTDGTYGVGTIDTQLQVNPNGAGWSNVSGVITSPGTAIGLSAATAYQFRVAYTDDYQTVYSNTVSLTTGNSPDVTAPEILTMVIPSAGTTLVVTYTEVETPPVLPASAVTGFSLTSDSGSAITVSSGTRTSSVVHTFTLSRTIYSTEVLTGSYSPGNISDSAGPANNLPTQSGIAVTNNSTFSQALTSVTVDAIILSGVATTITWSSAGISSTVDILLSTDGGSTFPIEITTGTANDGSFAWAPALGNVTATGMIRVRDHAEPGTFFDDSAAVIIATTTLGADVTDIPKYGDTVRYRQISRDETGMTVMWIVERVTDGGGTLTDVPKYGDTVEYEQVARDSVLMQVDATMVKIS